MSPRARSLLSLAAIVVVLLGAAVAGFFQIFSRRPAPLPAATVPASWAQYRTSSGHTAHIEKASVACRECHDVDRGSFAGKGAQICAQCHEKQMKHTHAGGEQRTDCLTCHSFAPTAAPQCIDCHREARGVRHAVVQHAEIACKECHHPHEEPAISPKSCESCHEERAEHHGMHPGSNGCLDCHSVHAPGASALATCTGCHQKTATTALQAHDSCTTCHKPHEFATGTQMCAGCHGQKTTLASGSVAAHARCTSCHAPHAPQNAERACQRCHEGVEVTHGGHEACTSCHSPHGDRARVVAANCTSCHANVASTDRGAHAGNEPCTACHAPHAFPAAPRGELCAQCHAKEANLTKVGAGIQHATLPNAGLDLQSSRVNGHGQCAFCHGATAHRPEITPSCPSCHSPEATSAPLGHRKCQSCHEPHSGAKLQSSCTACHENKPQSQHGDIRGGCENCHRAHGPSGIAVPPPCTSCHAKPKLPALHAVAQHGECSQCHGSHAPPRADRATCTSGCHADRRDHQPTAAVCSGCHVFRD